MGGSVKKLVNPFSAIKDLLSPKIPKPPKPPAAPTTNTPDVGAALEAERQAEAKRQGRASTVLAGDVDEEVNKAKRTLLGG